MIWLNKIAAVAYAFGVQQIYLNSEAQNMDYEDIESLCSEIVSDWENFYDIRNVEEEGHIIPYAERVLIERYGKKKI